MKNERVYKWQPISYGGELQYGWRYTLPNGERCVFLMGYDDDGELRREFVPDTGWHSDIESLLREATAQLASKIKQEFYEAAVAASKIEGGAQ